jgi:O-antigen/teichoic acid export membrane protein
VASFASLAFLGLFTSVAIARVYGVEVIGQYALSFAPVAALGMLSTTQEQPALMRKLAVLDARAPRTTGLVCAVFAFSLSLTVAVALPVLGVTYVVFEGPIGQPALFLPAMAQVIGYAVFTNSCWNLDTVFSSFRAGRQLFWIRLHQAVTFFAVAMVAGAVRATVWGLVIATIASWATALVHRVWAVRVFLVFRVPRKEVAAGFRDVPEIVRFGAKLVPGSLLTGVGNQAGTWILGIVSTVSAVGAWNRAETLGIRLQDATVKTAEMLIPTLVERREAGDHEGHDRALMVSVRYAATGMLLIAAVGGGASVGVMNVFGPGFSSAATALALLLVAESMFIVTTLLGVSIMAAGDPWRVSIVSSVRSVTIVASSIFLSLSFGVTGAALAMCIGTGIALALFLVLAQRVLSGSIRRFVSTRWLIASAIAYSCGFLAARLLDNTLDGHSGTVVALAAGCVVYVSAFVGLGGIDETDRERLRMVTGRLRRRGAAERSVS